MDTESTKTFKPSAFRSPNPFKRYARRQTTTRTWTFVKDWEESSKVLPAKVSPLTEINVIADSSLNSIRKNSSSRDSNRSHHEDTDHNTDNSSVNSDAVDKKSESKPKQVAENVQEKRLLRSGTKVTQSSASKIQQSNLSEQNSVKLKNKFTCSSSKLSSDKEKNEIKSSPLSKTKTSTPSSNKRGKMLSARNDDSLSSSIQQNTSRSLRSGKILDDLSNAAVKKPNNIGENSDGQGSSLELSPVKPQSVKLSPVKPQSVTLSPVKPQSVKLSPVKPQSVKLSPVKPQSDTSVDSDKVTAKNLEPSEDLFESSAVHSKESSSQQYSEISSRENENISSHQDDMFSSQKEPGNDHSLQQDDFSAQDNGEDISEHAEGSLSKQGKEKYSDNHSSSEDIDNKEIDSEGEVNTSSKNSGNELKQEVVSLDKHDTSKSSEQDTTISPSKSERQFPTRSENLSLENDSSTEKSYKTSDKDPQLLDEKSGQKLHVSKNKDISDLSNGLIEQAHKDEKVESDITLEENNEENNDEMMMSDDETRRNTSSNEAEQSRKSTDANSQNGKSDSSKRMTKRNESDATVEITMSSVSSEKTKQGAWIDEDLVSSIESKKRKQGASKDEDLVSSSASKKMRQGASLDEDLGSPNTSENEVSGNEKSKPPSGKLPVRINSPPSSSKSKEKKKKVDNGQEHVVPMWCGGIIKRQKKDILDLDILLDCVSETLAKERDDCDTNAEEKAVQRLMIYMKKEITDTIDKVESVKTMGVGMKHSKTNIKGLRKQLLKTEKDKLRLTTEIAEKKKEFNENIHSISNWMNGFEKLMKSNSKRLNKLPQNMKLLTFGHFPVFT